ncbi:MAG: hypothetical protein WC459_05020, partial [Patescibacteria group bacterium]
MVNSLQSKLPSSIKDYLLSSEINDRNKRIIEKYKFGNEEKKIYFGIVLKLFLKEITIFSLPAVLMKTLNITDDKVLNNLVEDIKKTVLFPVEEYFQDSGKANYEHKVLIEKAVGKFNLALDEKLRSRLDELAESFFAGARTKTQFKNSLMKSVETGGMGWDKEISGQVAEFFASYLRIKEIEKKKENKIPPGLPLQKGGVNSTVSLAPAPLKEERQGGFLKLDRPDFKPEEREAEKFKSKVMDLKSAAPPDLSKKLSNALNEIDLDFPSSELNDRLKNIIDARLRNVRTSVQTMERLTLAAANGGLGLLKEEADKVLLILNKYLDASNKDLYESSMSAIKEMEQKEKTEREQKESANREQEEKMLNEKFKKLTGKEAPLPSAPVIPDVPSVVEGQYSGIQKKDGEKSFPTSLLQR